jgi:hypothetical protein
MDKGTKILNDIFQREIDRLNERSIVEALTAEEVELLYKLVKSYSTFKSRLDDEVDELDTLSTEELEERLR